MNYIINHSWLYYILQWTWGIIINICGLFCFIFMLCIKGKINYCKPIIYIVSPILHNCGFSMGMFFFIGEGCESCALHEMGHSIQNIIFGPFTLLIIGLPSTIRFWWRKWQIKRGKENQLLPYDSLWIEGTATKWGNKYFYNIWKQHISEKEIII